MHDSEARFIVAVENTPLREALAAMLTEAGLAPEVIPPGTLPTTDLAGYVYIFIETSDETPRLSATIRQVYGALEGDGRSTVQFIAYVSAPVCTDRITFDLWSIGPEMTVIVQCWEPGHLEQWMKEARSFAVRVAATNTSPPLQQAREG